MGTDGKIKPRRLRPLTPEILSSLNDRVLLDPDDPDDAARAASMHEEIRRALDAYPHQEVWMDRARPANRLKGLAHFQKRLVALLEAFDDLDDVTWQDIDTAHEPGLADSRNASSVRLALDQIAGAAGAVESDLKREAQRTSSQHPPTTEARQELINELVRVFAKYAPKESGSPVDERKERLKFVRTVLEAADIPCPEHDDNLGALIDRL